MTTLLQRRAEETPDVVYLEVEGAEPVTYRELHERSLALAGGLRRLGVERGSSVAVLTENCIESVYLWFACSALGALYVPLNSALHGPFLEHQLRTADVRVLAVDPVRLADVAAIEDTVSGTLRTVVVTGKPGDTTLRTTPVFQFDAVWADGQRAPLELDDPPRWNDPAVVLFTSGTTGPSKGAILSHNYLVHMARIYAEQLKIQPGDAYYSGTPLFHLSGAVITILAPLVAGARAVLDRTFSVSRYWRRVRETQATHGLLIGAMVQMLWNREPDEDERDNTMRAAVFAPMPVEIHEQFEQRFGLHAVTGFGLTEVGTISLCSVDEPAPLGWSGKALPSCEIIIANDDDEPVPPHTPGEILVRPLEPHIIFEGYMGDPEATLRVFRNLWFHTGDIGEMDEEGNIRFLDRKKDYLRRRGENISSMEAEAAILRHPAIAEAAVIGVPSEMPEDEVKACVVLAPGASVTCEQILEHCIETLPYFAVPRFIELVEALPKTPSGKIRKAELRQRHDPAAAWDREAAGITVGRETRRQLISSAPH